MSPRQLKSLIQSGHYKPEPALIAEAMLQRRGVRILLAGGPASSIAAGRSREAPAHGRPAI